MRRGRFRRSAMTGGAFPALTANARSSRLNNSPSQDDILLSPTLMSFPNFQLLVSVVNCVFTLYRTWDEYEVVCRHPTVPAFPSRPGWLSEAQAAIDYLISLEPALIAAGVEPIGLDAFVPMFPAMRAAAAFSVHRVAAQAGQTSPLPFDSVKVLIESRRALQSSLHHHQFDTNAFEAQCRRLDNGSSLSDVAITHRTRIVPAAFSLPSQSSSPLPHDGDSISAPDSMDDTCLEEGHVPQHPTPNNAPGRAAAPPIPTLSDAVPDHLQTALQRAFIARCQEEGISIRLPTESTEAVFRGLVYLRDPALRKVASRAQDFIDTALGRGPVFFLTADASIEALALDALHFLIDHQKGWGMPLQFIYGLI